MLTTITSVVLAKTTVTLFARIIGAAGVPITQADVASIAYAVTNLSAGAAVGTGAFVVASTVTNTLVQDDPRWTRDGPAAPGDDGNWGYNFTAILAASLFPVSAQTVAGVAAPDAVSQVDVAFTMADGTTARLRYRLTTAKVFA